MKDNSNIMVKMVFLYICMVIFGISIIVKIVYLQFFYDKENFAEALGSTIIEARIEPTRGDIYSSDGKLMATSVARYEVGVDLNCEAITQEVFNDNVDSLAICLCEIFPHKTKEKYKQELMASRDKGSRYYRINYKASFSQFKKLEQCPLLRKGRLKGGFVYAKTFTRQKPCGILASRTIGSLNPNKVGNVGLEAAFNNELGGQVGYTVKERISGSLWMPVENAQTVKPIDGMDLISTIDVSIQDVTETALENQLRKHNAKYGTAVVMEVETGKIRAIANLERKILRDKNGNPVKDEEGNIQYSYQETLNYAVGEATDPGSTFKLASMLVALEDGYVTPDQMVETGNGVIKYYGKAMKDTKVGGYGTITLKEAFEVSSNVGLSKIINENYKHQPDKYVEGLYRLHLHEPLGVVIKGEAIPVIHHPNEKGVWSGLSLTQMSIGYELQISPLQILTLYNAIANNGKMMRPIFAEALSYRGKIQKIFEPEVIDPQICSPKTIEIIKEMLEGVVENGTAKNIKNSNYKIAGKTGTAQMNYGNDTLGIEYHASFVGYFPADDPKYTCIVSVYRPNRKGFYGNVVAGPVFKEIADRIYSTDPNFHKADTTIHDVPTIPLAKKGCKKETDIVYKWLNYNTNINSLGQTEWIIPTIDNEKVIYKPINFSDDTRVPNVIGMGLKDAIVILENAGLNVKVSGRGRVTRQVPGQGNHYRKGDDIVIILG
ncbi:MAG: transpeptidase family protein [Bacteroidales bacterium]|jgi:cell division protein FtsI (penicillin-binding protein 3)|nr:transpeptidase family protein [Bacteroidales bacterium]